MLVAYEFAMVTDDLYIIILKTNKH